MAQAEKHQSVEETQQEKRQQQYMMLPEALLQSSVFSGKHLSERINGEDAEEEEEEEEEEEGVELSLGLSMNGKFGVDPRAKKLSRSSSIPDFLTPTASEDGSSAFMVPMASSSNLVRTCSLPTETEHEWRKRKEMQMLRRMEAKRKRLEKQKNFKAVKDSNGLFNGGVVEGLLPPSLTVAPKSQPSIGSQGRGSSCISEPEGHPIQGLNKCAESRSPSCSQSVSESDLKLDTASRSTTNNKPNGPSVVPSHCNGSGKAGLSGNRAKGSARNMLEDMPCVSTTGDGPDGKKIEGFLYQYKKGEEVRILCVCHGSFFTPAEFVKHAGGGDVTHPLKHIVVSPTPLF